MVEVETHDTLKGKMHHFVSEALNCSRGSYTETSPKKLVLSKSESTTPTINHLHSLDMKKKKIPTYYCETKKRWHFDDLY